MEGKKSKINFFKKLSKFYTTVFGFVFVSAFLFGFWAINETEAEVSPGEGMIIYADSTVSSPDKIRTRIWNSDQSWASEGSASISSNSSVHYIAMRGSQKRNEYIAVLQEENGSGNPVVRAVRYNGSNWVTDWTETIAATTTENNNLRYVQVAYEDISGDAMVLWSEWNSTSNEIAYKIWNGNSWTASSSFDVAGTTAQVCGMIAKSIHETDKIILGYSVNATTNSLNAAIWDGSSWGSNPSTAIETGALENGTACNQWSFDIDYEDQSQDALLVWGKSGNNVLSYSTCTAGSLPCTWSASSTFATESGDNIALDSLDGTNELIVSTIGADSGNDSMSCHWTGSTWDVCGGGDTSMSTSTTQAGAKLVANSWIIDGSNVRGIGAAIDASTADTNIDYARYDGSMTKVNSNCGTNTGSLRQMFMFADPIDKSRALAFTSDVNSDLFSRYFNLAGTTIGCGDAGMAGAVNANISGRAYNFSFANFSDPTQTHYRWYQDDAAPGSATPISAEDIPASSSEALYINNNYRLRVQLSNEGPASASNNKYRLEMTKAAGSSCSVKSPGWNWFTLPLAPLVASHAFDIEDSTSFSDGASISSALLTASDPTFINGYALDNRATSGFESLNGDNYTELEWNIKPNSYAVDGGTYCFRVGRIYNASTTPDTIGSISYSIIASASVQAPATSTFTQNNYRWYYNVDNIDPTGSITNENSAPEIVTTQPVRLRVSLTVGTANLSAGQQAFKLKYATDLGGPWYNIGATTSFSSWKFYKNGSVPHGTTLTTSKLTGTDVLGVYHASNSMPTNPNSATITQDVEYDFSLNPARAQSGTTYYFRVFKANDDSLSGFNNDPSASIAVISPPGGGGGTGVSIGGESGGGTPEGGGDLSGGDEPIDGSGGGVPTSGGDPGAVGGASPVIFFFWWALGNISFSNPQVILMLFLSSFAGCILATMVFVEKEVAKHRKRMTNDK